MKPVLDMFAIIFMTLASAAVLLVVSSFMSELSPVRAELLGFLTHAFLGDSLAAEYLILHLISTV